MCFLMIVEEQEMLISTRINDDVIGEAISNSSLVFPFPFVLMLLPVMY